jgi:uncharacterized membrane protein
MKRSTKAVLLSAFIFPGAGHVFLKKYIPGLILICASLASTYYIVSKTVEESMQIVEQIQSGYVQPDVASIEELVSNQSAGADAYLLDIATYIFIICWLIGIIDSYRVGRARDKDNVI